jgi:hypothetical protein
MQNRTVARVAAIIAVLVLAIAGTTAPAQARTYWDENLTYHAKAHDGATHYEIHFQYKWGTTPRKGPDVWRMKPMYASAAVHVTHPNWHPKTWCWQNPPGARDYYVFDFRVWNPDTGLDTHRKVKVDCESDGSGAGHRIITHMPECRVPARYSGGRNPEPRREWCRVSVHVETVNVGPSRNTHGTVVRRHIIKR